MSALKKLIVALATIGAIPGAMGQQLIPYLCENLYGFADYSTGKIAIPCRFDSVHPFSPCGLAEVRIGERWHLLRFDGRLADGISLSARPKIGTLLASQKASDKLKGWIRIQENGNSAVFGMYNYERDEFSGFIYRANSLDCTEKSIFEETRRENLHEVFKRNDHGFFFLQKMDSTACLIHFKGNTIFDADYTDFYFFSSKRLAVRNKEGKYALADTSGKFLTPFLYGKIESQQNGNFFKVYNRKYSLDELYGNCAVFSDINCGLLDNTGNIILDTIFNNIFVYHDSLVLVTQKQRSAIWHIRGHFILPYKYNTLTRCFNNFWIFGHNGCYGLMNSDGQVIQENTFDKLFTIEGKYFEFVRNGMTGLLDSNGSVLFEKKIGYLSLAHESGVFKFFENNKFGLINLKGEVICPPEYDNISTLDSASVLLFKKDQKYGFLSLTGQVIIPAIYEQVERKCNEYFAKKQNDWDVYDANLNKLGVLEDGYPTCASKGTLAVYGRNLYGLLDDRGVTVVSPQFTSITGLDCGIQKSHLFLAKKNKSITVIFDQNGKQILPDGWSVFQSGHFSSSQEKLHVVTDENQKEYGLLECSGNWLIRPSEGKINICSPQLLAKQKDRGWIFLDRNGKQLVEGYFQEPDNLIFKNKFITVSQPILDSFYIDTLFMPNGKVYSIEKIPVCYASWMDEHARILTDMNKYNFTYDFSENGLALARTGDKKGPARCALVDTTGKEVFVSSDYESLQSLKNRPYIIASLDGKKGLIDYSGNVIFPVVYDELGMLGTEHYTLSIYPDTFRCVDIWGNLIWDKYFFHSDRLHGFNNLFEIKGDSLILFDNSKSNILAVFDKNEAINHPIFNEFLLVKDEKSGKEYWVNLRSGVIFKNRE